MEAGGGLALRVWGAYRWKAPFCKFHWSFPFELVVPSRLLTQSVALCCFSITLSFFMSSRKIWKSAWTVSKTHTREKRKTLLAKSAKVHMFTVKYAKLWRSCCLWLKRKSVRLKWIHKFEHSWRKYYNKKHKHVRFSCNACNHAKDVN